MGKTKRYYNYPNNIRDIAGMFYHPYYVFCCGNCRMHKKWKPDLNKKKRNEYKNVIRDVVKNVRCGSLL